MAPVHKALVELVCIAGPNKGTSLYLMDLLDKPTFLCWNPDQGLETSANNGVAGARCRLYERPQGNFWIAAHAQDNVRVNGKLVDGDRRITHADIIEVEKARLVFVLPDPLQLASHVQEHLREAQMAQQRLRALRVAAQHCLHSLKNDLVGVRWPCHKALTAAQELPDSAQIKTVRESLSTALERVELGLQHARSYQALGRIGELERKDTDLCELCREAGSTLALPGHVRLEMELCDEVLVTSVDPVQITDVIRELLQNALDHLKNEPKAEIKVICRRARPAEVRKQKKYIPEGPPYGLVEVRQSGLPLAAEVKAKLFEPFFTTKTEGHGIGLWVARDVVELHDGCLTEVSRPNEGARFAMFLPLAE